MPGPLDSGIYYCYLLEFTSFNASSNTPRVKPTSSTVSSRVLYVNNYNAYKIKFKLETQTMISGDLDYMNKEKLQELREELGDGGRMLKAMIKSLENKH